MVTIWTEILKLYLTGKQLITLPNRVYYRTNFTEVVSLFSVIRGRIVDVKIEMHRIY